jgi:hypothetical protein
MLHAVEAQPSWSTYYLASESGGNVLAGRAPSKRQPDLPSLPARSADTFAAHSLKGNYIMLDAIQIRKFAEALSTRLPATDALLRSSNLTIHPAVSHIILHGSRGLAGGYRPDSDIDLSLLVDPLPALQLERTLQAAIETTLDHWRGPIELDLAAIFDLQWCELKCFDQTQWDEQICARGGVDCFGLYKTQKGFKGLITNAGVQVKLMYPCLKIWQRA